MALEKLKNRLENAQSDLKDLESDINSTIVSKKEEKPTSRKSLEPMTRLRKNIKEATEISKLDPDVRFIKDKLNDIIEGIVHG